MESTTKLNILNWQNASDPWELQSFTLSTSRPLTGIFACLLFWWANKHAHLISLHFLDFEVSYTFFTSFNFIILENSRSRCTFHGASEFVLEVSNNTRLKHFCSSKYFPHFSWNYFLYAESLSHPLAKRKPVAAACDCSYFSLWLLTETCEEINGMA